MQGGGATTTARAGAHVLGLLAKPLNGRIVDALAESPLRLEQLEQRPGWPPPTTLRTAVSKLCDAGILVRSEDGRTPHAVACELTAAGAEVLWVRKTVERWLAQAREPIELDSEAAKEAIKSLTGGWNATMIRLLALEPASLTDLVRHIPELSRASIERRLARMRLTHQIEPAPGEGRATPYAVTEWTRHSVAPLCAAGRWERRHMSEASAPITAIEIESAFLLALRLALLPESVSGSCVLSVQPEAGPNGEQARGVAGVEVEVRKGRLVRCVPEVREEAQVWALGKPMAWLDAVIDGNVDGIRVSGRNRRLPLALVTGLHRGLFGP